jgi:hypothetical protein
MTTITPSRAKPALDTPATTDEHKVSASHHVGAG